MSTIGYPYAPPLLLPPTEDITSNATDTTGTITATPIRRIRIFTNPNDVLESASENKDRHCKTDNSNINNITRVTKEHCVTADHNSSGSNLASCDIKALNMEQGISSLASSPSLSPTLGTGHENRLFKKKSLLVRSAKVS